MWFSSAQFTQSCLTATPWTAAGQASLSITNSWSLLKLMSVRSVMPFNHFILCRPLLLSIFPSVRVFSNESVLHIRWPKYWSFSFSISSFKEYSGLISFKMDWLELPAVQGTLKSLPQHHSVSSVYFSHPFVFYMFIFICSCALSSHLVFRLSFIDMSKPFTLNVVIERVRCK